MTITVDLRAAKIPWLGLIAVHYWFVVNEAQNCERWEIWQTQNVRGQSWGHLHFNLLKCEQGVGNGASWLEKRWQEEQALKLVSILRNSPADYPYNYSYRYYPGPNSNTYVQWILQQAKIDYRLCRRGLGRHYQNYAHFLTSCKNAIGF